MYLRFRGSDTATVVTVTCDRRANATCRFRMPDFLPRKPNLRSQQLAMSPARPTPPRQWTRIGNPRSVYALIMCVRWSSRTPGSNGTSPSGVGNLYSVNISRDLGVRGNALTSTHPSQFPPQQLNNLPTTLLEIPAHRRPSSCVMKWQLGTYA